MASLSNWISRHGHALVSSVGHLARNGLATLLAVGVMGLALALPLGLNTLVGNARLATGDFSGALGMTVYLKLPANEQTAQRLAQALRERAGVAEVQVTTAAQALEEFRSQPGLGSALDSLTDNPLPDVLTVRPAANATSPAQLDALRAAVEALPEVDSVQLDRDWLLRFNALLDLLRRVLWITAALLGAGVVAVVGNTIRLEIRTRSAEIEVIQLVGGSRGFVRRPFLYTGTLYGAVAGVLAWLLVTAARVALNPGVVRLASAYGQSFSLVGPSLRELGYAVICGLALGWIGAAVASSREIGRSAPRY